ncbi:MAG: TlpA family protein disulfide reductase [Planctomycetaceae bacterium]|jgi:thiol-disulfide isomerase/thioredoxin|nr:TlpA family protein disulfide reductase [Planctomycetaceae bacterium]
MFRLNETSSALCVIMLVVFVAFSVGAVLASVQEDKIPVSLDEAKTVADVDAFAKNALAKFANQRTEGAEEFAKMLREIGEIQLAASNKINQLASNDTDRENGLLRKFNALKFITQADDILSQNQKPSDHQAAFDETLIELSKNSKYAALANNELYQQFAKKVVLASAELFEKQFDQFITEAKKWANSKQLDNPAKPLILIAERATKSQELAEKTLNNLASFVNSGEFVLPEASKVAVREQLEGYKRRIVGSDPDIYGKTIDGKDFDWAALRGKYVLVNFTASWCGPCKRELPGMISAYEKYHDKGLEIVSIYIRDKLEDSKKIIAEEKLSWIFLSEDLTEKAGLPLQGQKYAVLGVPTMFIVDKNGKIIFTETRGEFLQEKLAQLFPESK